MANLWAEIDTDGEHTTATRGASRVETVFVQTHRGRIEVEMWSDGQTRVSYQPMRKAAGHQYAVVDGEKATLLTGNVACGEFEVRPTLTEDNRIGLGNLRQSQPEPAKPTVTKECGMCNGTGHRLYATTATVAQKYARDSWSESQETCPGCMGSGQIEVDA